MGGVWTRTESYFAASDDCKWTSWTEKAPPPCIRPLYPSLPPLILVRPYTNDALSQSEPCVLQCPHRTHSTFCGLRLKLGGLGQKMLVTSYPSLRGKEWGEERTKQAQPCLLLHSCSGPHMRYTPGLPFEPPPPTPASTHASPQYGLMTEDSEEHRKKEKEANENKPQRVEEITQKIPLESKK